MVSTVIDNPLCQAPPSMRISQAMALYIGNIIFKLEKKIDSKRAIYGNSLRARHQLKKLNGTSGYPMSNSPKRILNQSIKRRQV